MRFLFGLLAAILVLALAVFVAQNVLDVPLHFLGSNFQGNIWWIALGSAVLGFLTSLFLSLPGQIGASMRTRSVEHDVEDRENELSSLRRDHVQVVAERDNLRRDHEQLYAQNQQLTKTQQSLADERDRLVAERDNVAAERDRIANDRDNLRQRLQAATAAAQAAAAAATSPQASSAMPQSSTRERDKNKDTVVRTTTTTTTTPPMRNAPAAAPMSSSPQRDDVAIPMPSAEAHSGPESRQTRIISDTEKNAHSTDIPVTHVRGSGGNTGFTVTGDRIVDANQKDQDQNQSPSLADRVRDLFRGSDSDDYADNLPSDHFTDNTNRPNP